MIKLFEEEKRRRVPDRYYLSTCNAECRFQHRLRQAEEIVHKHVMAPLNQQQYDALVSFIVDKGYHYLRLTGILKDINNKDYDLVPDKIINCDEVGNKRRNAEAKLFSEKRKCDTERPTWLI